ncbi:MAG: DUF835 domain-containing protein [Thermoplasmata archaeon]|nr:MAG: DUF835 domain-containing protein [Thermoplasmata archaeon]
MKMPSARRMQKIELRSGAIESKMNPFYLNSKTAVHKCLSISTVLLLIFCFSLLCTVSLSDAQEPKEPIIEDEGQGIYTATWAFGNENFYNTSKTTIHPNYEVSLQSHNYTWTQSTKNEFDLGTKNNVTVTQESGTDLILSGDFEDAEHGILSGQHSDWQLGSETAAPDFIQTGDPNNRIWGTNLAGKYAEIGTPKDIFLRSPEIDLSNSMNTELRFFHYYDFEDDIGIRDGGMVEVSTDMENWVQVYPETNYDGKIADNNNPLNGKFSFGGNSSAWVLAIFDLKEYDGESDFYFRFRFATNGQVSYYGWYIDDIEIISTMTSEGEVVLEPLLIEMGNPAYTNLQRGANETVIDANNPVNFDGDLTRWEVHIAEPGKGLMRIFRMEGGTFYFVDETEMKDLVKGENSFNCSIPVKEGDLIGWYGETAQIYVKLDGTANSTAGNVTEDKAVSEWTPIDYTFSIKAQGKARYPQGDLTSQVFDALSPAVWEKIQWEEDVSSPGTDIVLSIRSGNSDTPDDGTWNDWTPGFTNPDGSTIRNMDARYIQFKATLTSSELLNTPILNNVTILYRKYSPSGMVETRDFMPDADNDDIPDIVVQWRSFTSSATLNGQNISYQYSTDSGVDWENVPQDGNMRAESVLSGKIRFKAILSAHDTTVSPVLREMNLEYSSAQPKMALFIEPLQKTVKPGGTVSYKIYYDNQGIGDAQDVSITLYLDGNITYKSDDSTVVPTYESGNVIRWQFNSVAPGNRTITVDTGVIDTDEEFTTSTYGILNYTDIGGNSYNETVSNTAQVKVEIGPDLLLFYLLLGVISVIIVVVLFSLYRYRTLDESTQKISFEVVERGIGYLIMEENPRKSYTLFSDLINEGYNGLCITRTFPERVRSHYYFEGISILWLSRRGDTDSILPTNLGSVVSNIKDFMKKNEDSVILLDGLEYLIVHNDFEKVLKLVHALNELTAINKSILIMPVNFLTMDDDKVALLKRDLKVLG